MGLGIFEHAPVFWSHVPPLLHWSAGQVTAAPGLHWLPMHISPFVQAFLSVHGVVSGRPAHDVTGTLPGHARHWYTWSAIAFGAAPLGGFNLFTPQMPSGSFPQVSGPQLFVW
jgi:hypothetical protein